MSRSIYKIRAIGLKVFFPVLLDLIVSKMSALIPKNYKKQSLILDEFYSNQIAKVKLDKLGNWNLDFIKNNTNFKVKLRNNDSDVLVFRQVFINNEYGRFFEMAGKRKKEEVRIIDLGGNIGLTSIYAKLFFSDFRLTCVEPSDQNCSLLKENFKFNNIQAEVILKGIWTKVCRLTLKNDFRDGLSWSNKVIEDPNGEIEAIGLLELIGADIVDVLKMDIEGTEFELFRDKLYAEKFLSKVKFMAIEIHDDIGDRSMINDILTDNGFDFFVDGELTVCVNKRLVD